MFGALLGAQKGRQVEISNSFELAVDIINDSAVLDKEYFSAKEEQCKYSNILMKNITKYCSQAGILITRSAWLVHQWHIAC